MYEYNATYGYLTVNQTSDNAPVFTFRDEEVSTGTGLDHMLNFTPPVGTPLTSLSAANYSQSWKHINLNFESGSTTQQICLNAVLNCATFILDPSLFTTVGLHLNLFSATFREVKMFSYRRSPSEQNYFMRVQSDPSAGLLDFYFPLTGAESTNYLFNAMSPDGMMLAPLKNVRWETEPASGIFMCPRGYVYEGTQSDTTYLPTCIRKN